jgi:N-glycosidase YbiA
MTIYFYNTREKPYGCFSNFSRHGFDLDGLWWPTSEHYFQALKFPEHPYSEAIRLATTAKEAADLGRSRLYSLRTDWEMVKEEIMYRGVLRKFTIHSDIRQILLGTRDILLVENSPIDYYWGCGSDGSGQNRLGHVLMAVRTVLAQL